MANSERTSYSPAPRRILIVDDSSLVRLYYRETLEKAGSTTDQAINGIEAMKKVLAAAVAKLRARSFTLDGEVAVCGLDGSPSSTLSTGAVGPRSTARMIFDRCRWASASRSWSGLLAGASTGIFNEHTDEDGTIVFEHACRFGFEGIVSKRLTAPYRSGPCKDWIKGKNPDSPAMIRHREGRWR